MTTVPARFEFLCDKKNFSYTHQVPSSLVNIDAAHIQNDLQKQKVFVDVCRQVLPEHYPAALAACQDACCVCGSPKTNAALTPISWLHIVADPFVSVLATPICNKGECDLEARREVQKLMAKNMDFTSPGDPFAPKVTTEIKACRVCSKLENTKKCARCGVVFYCGKEHQAADWPVHKLACKQVTST